MQSNLEGLDTGMSPHGFLCVERVTHNSFCNTSGAFVFEVEAVIFSVSNKRNDVR